jgi:hypothetical protein
MVEMRKSEVIYHKFILKLGDKFFAKMKQKDVMKTSRSKYSYIATRKLLSRKAV